MRLATWNIRAGGGKRLAAIADSILDANLDVIVLTEFRLKPGQELLERLAQQGFSATYEEIEGNHNCTCIFSKIPLESGTAYRRAKGKHRWTEVGCPQTGLTILGVHMPNPGEEWSRPQFWDQLEHFAKKKAKFPSVILGDLNAALGEDCQPSVESTKSHILRLTKLGWMDAWRHMNSDSFEYTWYSHRNNGFRIDYCFVSPGLKARIMKAWHHHAVREDRLSDHSMLIVELDL